MGGIYSLTCRENGKRYIGQTVDLNKRKNEHFCMLSKGKHPNKHLQNAWNKGASFDFEIIEECDKAELNDREVYWIAHFDTMDATKGYNLCAGGKSTTGRKCSEETRRKIAEGNRGKKIPRDVIKKRTETLRRRIEEDPEFAKRHKETLQNRHKGNTWNKGRPCPEWKKELLREKLKGRNVSEEHRTKLRELYSGEGSLSAKLKRSDVVEIRCRFLSGEPQIEICKDYPVSAQTIYDIVRGRRWKSVPMDKESLERERSNTWNNVICK